MKTKTQTKRMNKKLIVGLGNPGDDYKQTRHNAGFMAVDFIAEQNSAKFTASKKTDSQIAEFDNFVLAKPETFMNNSGRALVKLIKYFNIAAGDILVIYDDVDLPVGEVRFRNGGGSAGHKGMQSIIDSLGNQEIKRIRIGVGKSEQRPTEEHVLRRFPKSELTEIKTAIQEAAQIATT